MEEETVLSAAEAAEFGEFKRARRETEISFTLAKLMVDASRRETDRAALRHACDAAVKLGAAGVLVSPIHVARAQKALKGKNPSVCCLVGGTGESVMAVKKMEAKKALRQGAKEVRLVLCYSELTGGGLAYLRREIRKVRRAVKKGRLTVSLEDHSLGVEEVALGVRAALSGRADAVCVRGESELVLRAVKEGAGKLLVEASGVQNAEQLRLLIKAGASRATTGMGEEIAEELFRALSEELHPPRASGREGKAQPPSVQA